MARIVVEQLFDRARGPGTSPAPADDAVRLLAAYASPDGRRAVSFFEAASLRDVERLVQSGAASAVWVWEATVIGEPFERVVPPMHAMVVQRVWDPPTTREEQRALRGAAGHCLELHRVRPLGTHLAHDGRRQVCTFEGPDAESVRLVNRSMGDPFETVWVARTAP